MMICLWPVLARFFPGVEREDRFISTPRTVNAWVFVGFRLDSCELVGCPSLSSLCTCRASVKRHRCVLLGVALSPRTALSFPWSNFFPPRFLCPFCECGCIFVSCTVCAPGLRLCCGACVRFELEGRSVLRSCPSSSPSLLLNSIITGQPLLA